MTTVVVDRRFRGPSGSANGGYFAGLVARHAKSTVTVRLLRPPPLDEPLEIEGEGDLLVVQHPGGPVAETRPGTLALRCPAPPDYAAALNASRHYAGFAHHEFPECFVCGPQRARGDGLRIFTGPCDDERVAAPWVPGDGVIAGDGKVAAEFMWAALDCPGYFAWGGSAPMLLGEFTAHIDRRVHASEACVIVGWRLGESGRKRLTGTALYDEDGDVCARAIATWIAPREGA